MTSGRSVGLQVDAGRNKQPKARARLKIVNTWIHDVRAMDDAGGIEHCAGSGAAAGLGICRGGEHLKRGDKRPVHVFLRKWRHRFSSGTSLVNTARRIATVLGERLPKCDADQMGFPQSESLPPNVQHVLEPLLKEVGIADQTSQTVIAKSSRSPGKTIRRPHSCSKRVELGL